MGNLYEWIMEKIVGAPKMRIHNQKILDLRYQKAMVAKTQSSNPHVAAIGRRGLALRSSCIRSKQNSVKLKRSSAASSLSPDEEPLGGATLSRQNTELTEVQTEEEIKKVLKQVPQWQPGSFGQSSDSTRATSYAEVIAAKSEPLRYQKSDPTKIAERPAHIANMQEYGASYWFFPPDHPERLKMSYNELPLQKQRERVWAHVYGWEFTMSYPDWHKPKCKGVGRYRMSVDLPRDEMIRNLVDSMGSIADCLGIVGDLLVEEFDGIKISSLLCVKYEKEMRQKLQGPTSETVDGTNVVRGFPIPLSKRLKGAETFLKPLTYAAFEFQPYDKISEHRLVHNHYFTGKESDQAEILKKDRRGEAKVVTSPKAIQFDPDLPEAVGFTLEGQPDYVRLPDRHPGIKNSELEALACNPIPVGNPQQNPATPIAIANQAAAPTNGQLQRPRRPNLQRKTSDKGAKIKTKKSKATTLGKKRTISIVEPIQPQREAGPSDAHPAAAAATTDQAVAADTLNALIDGAASSEDTDSPPSYLLATSAMEKAAIKRTLRPESNTLRCFPEIMAAKQTISAADCPSPAATVPHSTANSTSSHATSLPRSIPNSSQTSSHTLVESETQAVTAKSPGEAAESYHGEGKSRSVPIEKHDSDQSKRRVRWESNLVHTNEQGGFKPHSIYNYSKAELPRTPAHEVSEVAVEDDDDDEWEEA